MASTVEQLACLRGLDFGLWTVEMFGSLLADVKIVLALFLFGAVSHGKDISQLAEKREAESNPTITKCGGNIMTPFAAAGAIQIFRGAARGACELHYIPHDLVNLARAGS
ncbi:hypothetical protein BDZ89DRAFT_1168370 [Hymenopellis radicata]|nr:hypothetical protein BDZ89DRAFT_1168370 [Hymenopellis radicata]